MRHSSNIDNNKYKILWTQADLVDFISGYIEIDSDVVQKVFSALEEIIINHLKYDFDSFGDNIITEIKLFNGLTIDAEKIPERDYFLNGETVTATPRIKARAHLSRCFVRRTLNGLADG